MCIPTATILFIYASLCFWKTKAHSIMSAPRNCLESGSYYNLITLDCTQLSQFSITMWFSSCHYLYEAAFRLFWVTGPLGISWKLWVPSQRKVYISTLTQHAQFPYIFQEAYLVGALRVSGCQVKNWHWFRNSSLKNRYLDIYIYIIIYRYHYITIINNTLINSVFHVLTPVNLLSPHPVCVFKCPRFDFKTY